MYIIVIIIDTKSFLTSAICREIAVIPRVHGGEAPWFLPQPPRVAAKVLSSPQLRVEAGIEEKVGVAP